MPHRDRPIFSHGEYVYLDDLRANRLARKFLREHKQPTVHRHHPKPQLATRYDDFVRLACAYSGWKKKQVCRWIQLQLHKTHAVERDVEAYLNYPALSTAEIAEALGLSVRAVNNSWEYVYQTWPILRRIDAHRAHATTKGCASALHMQRLPDNAETLVDMDSVVRF